MTIFKYNSKTKMIIVGYDQIKCDNQEVLNYFKNLEETNAVTIIKDNVTVVSFKSNCLLFGYKKEDECFQECFRFDLKDYLLKTPDNRKLGLKSIESLNYHNPEFIDCPEWVACFYYYACYRVYANTNRTKLMYLIKYLSEKPNKILALEKLLKSGFVPEDKSYDALNQMLACVPTDKSDYSGSPWTWYNMSKNTWKFLCTQAKAIARNYRVENILSFPYLDMFQPYLKTEQDFNQITACQVAEDVTELKEIGYDLKRLSEYVWVDCKKQNLDVHTALHLLRDYARGCSVIGDTSRRYPKYLRSEHDIIAVKVEQVQQEVNEQKFREVYENKDFSYKVESWVIQAPKSAEDVVEEGKEMHHCVATYVDKVLNGETLIYFLRKRIGWCEDERHLTLEIKNNCLCQARGKYNRNPNADELKVLNEFHQFYGLSLDDHLKELIMNVENERKEIELCAT